MISFSEYKKIAHSTKQQRINGDALYAVSRFISVRLSFLLIWLFPKIKPNHVSVSLIFVLLLILLSNIFYGIISAFCLILVQLLFLQLTAIGDRVDGEIARFQSYFTQSGIYYDRIFHFIFPFALYVSIGYYFALISGLNWLIAASILVATLASLSNLLGKLRHHIKYKIILENHSQEIQDLYHQVLPLKPSSFFSRLSHYLVFMMYDWVWFFYLLTVLLSVLNFPFAFWFFLTHTVFTFSFLSYYIFITYPNYHLFSKSDFN